MFRVALFLALIATIYLLAAVFAVQWVRERRGGARPASPGARSFRRVIFGLAVLGAGCIAYGYFVEPNWPEVTRVRIETPKLSRAARPVRIVLLSDLHSDPKPRLEPRLPGLVAELKPDVILFAGDSINEADALPVFRDCLQRLAAVAPTFVVKGNWDVAPAWGELDLFGGTGAHELDGEAMRLTVESAELRIAGLAFGNASQIQIRKLLTGPPRETFTVFLYHTPDKIFEVAHRGADLYCAGHTHGGQVALPFYGALVTLSRYGKRFEAGLHRVEQTWLYVNRGIGMDGDPWPRVRFAARPEITLIELVGTRE